MDKEFLQNLVDRKPDAYSDTKKGKKNPFLFGSRPPKKDRVSANFISLAERVGYETPK
jgi:hypothetical protein